LQLAQHEQDPVFAEAETRFGLGGPLLYLGQGAAARLHLERGIALCDPQQHRSLAFLYGVNPGVFCQSYIAWTLWWLGYPEQALKRAHEALTLAQEQAHPLSLATALYYVAWLHQCRREVQVARERTEAEIALCTEQGFAYWLPLGTILQGWLLTEQGKGKEGILQMRQDLAAYWATGAELNQSYCLALLAEAYGRMEHAEEGLSVLAEALAKADKTGERHYEAELYRLKGELSLKAKQVKISQDKSEVTNPQPLTPNSQAEAEGCFWKAIEIARRQQAKSWELRATISLARLWQQQGKKAEAHQMLVKIYSWFTEGFDTKDLQEAKALLEELQ
jgi:predicted ATPase